MHLSPPEVRAPNRFAESIIMASGVLTSLLGLTVMFGHLQNITFLVQFNPRFTAMVFNTAMCFFLSGLALLLLVSRWRPLAFYLALPVLTLSLLTAIEYFFHVDIGIDRLFVEPFIKTLNPFPGRMAPHTALAFFLSSIGFMIRSRARLQRGDGLGLAILSSIVIAFGAVSLFGYAADIRMPFNLARYFSPMAVHTAFGFVLVGIGLFALAWEDDTAGSAARIPRWIPVPIGVGLLAFAILLWQVLLSREAFLAQRALDAQLLRIKDELSTRLEFRVLSLVRQAKRWDIWGPPNRAQWEGEVRLRLQHGVGFQRVEWIDPQLQMRWTYPASEREFDGRERELLHRAKEVREPMAAVFPDPSREGHILRVFLPIFSESDPNRFSGFIGAESSIKKLLDQMLGNLAPSYAFRFLRGTEEFYRHGESSFSGDIRGDATINAYNDTWRLEVAPSVEDSRDVASVLPHIVLAIGALLSLLLAVTIYFAQQARRQAVNEKAAKVHLEREIHERRQAESSLAAEKTILQTILNHMGDGVAVIDDREQFLIFNPMAEKILGRDAIQDTPEAWSDHYGSFLPDEVTPVPPDRHPLIRSVRNQEAIDQEEVFIKNPNVPQGIWISVTSRPFAVEGGGLNGALAVFRDITEAKISKRKLEQSNRELERFAYVASHDLQEPLRMVASYCQLLAKNYRGRLDRDADEFIDFAVDGAKRMQSLINDLLLYSRVSSQAKESIETNCEEVLARVLKYLEGTVSEAAAKVTHDPLPTIKIDPSQFTQLLQNLLANAIKFRNGPAPNVHISATKKSRMWTFSVRDNGIGMEMRHAEKIFQLFQRLHAQKDYPGTGIGLAICQKIVERHGGKIWVDSAPNQGSTFYFTIPA